MHFGTKKADTEMEGQLDSVSELPKGILRPRPPAALLSTPRRELLLQHIWQRTSLSRSQFQRLYRAPIERYANLVQQFPASESHHHAYLGGMLDHGLEIVAFGLKLRQSYLLPIGAPPEVQAAQADAWTAATAYAALLHDVGKLAVDLEVEYADGTCWHPWHGPLTRPYRFRFRVGRVHRLHEAAAGLLYATVLGEAILDWLSGFPELWAALIYVLASRHEHAGVLAELVVHADRASVAQALGGDPAKARADGQRSLQGQLREGLRYLIRERFKLNQPQASDGWLTEDALWLVSKTACDKLRAHLLSNAIAGIPENNSVLFDVLQEHGLVQATPEGKAIWTARVIGTNGWTHDFTLLKVAPSLIWESGDRPSVFQGYVLPAATEASSGAGAEKTVTGRGALQSVETRATIPAAQSSAGRHRPDTVDLSLEQMQTAREESALHPAGPHDEQLTDSDSTPAAIEPRETTAAKRSEPYEKSSIATSPSDKPLGERFLDWLKHSVRTRRLIVNEAKALVHSVDGTAFVVTPRIFQRFLQEFPVIPVASRDAQHSGWMAVQKSFERLGRHRKRLDGLNIWTCEVTGPRKTRRVNGYLLLDGSDVFMEIPPDNPFLRLGTAPPEAGE